MPIEIIDTLKPKNNGTFPLIQAHDIALDNGTRLDVSLETITASGGTATLPDNVVLWEDEDAPTAILFTAVSSSSDSGSSTTIIQGVPLSTGLCVVNGKLCQTYIKKR